MRSGNPVLTDSTFEALPISARAMTVRGVVGRTFFLLILVAASAALSWSWASQDASFAMPGAMGGALGGFAVGLLTSFRPAWSRFLAPCYALLEGLFIGAISVFLERRFPGIVFQAVCLTFSVMFALLAGYQAGIIRVSQTFRSVVTTATLGIVFLYLGNMVFSLFTHHGFSLIEGSGPLSIGFSLIVAGIAALNLVLDFDFISQGVQARAPRWMEWYGAFALIVTLVWLYVEILRLLSKLRRSS
ncbi:MAG TPA: Bax inhibitor-1/YccA family protein [Chthoniobacterales bacterium]